VNALAAAGCDLIGRTGWHLFPVVGKVPATPHGFKDATSDPDHLDNLLRVAPDADALAVACGASSLAVLDLDVMEGADGRDSLREHALPYLDAKTVRATTPRGGEHVYFAGSLQSRTGLLPGVDMKGRGGYVVVPPASGRAWLADAGPFDLERLAPVPEWLSLLVARFDTGPVGEVTRLWETAIAAYVSEGSRNETAASIAGHLLRRKVDERLAGVLLVAWARTFCHPPLEDREALRVFHSIRRREASR
jgi:putative DNA primase/helicase